SRDGTADLAVGYDGVRVSRLPRNLGYAGGNNIGAELARAELIVFLNQDVVVHRSWLHELVAAIKGDESIAAAHANTLHPWNPEFGLKERQLALPVAYYGELARLGFVEYRRADATRPILDTLFLSGVSIILKRGVIPLIGGYVFDPDMFLYGEDMDLAL